MNYKYIYGFIIVLVVVLVGTLAWQKSNKKISYYTISGEEALTMVKNEDVTIIDVRTSLEYNSGHIKDAINIPVDKISEDITDLLGDKNAYYLVYCRSGSRSREAVKKLAKLGYKKVYDLGSVENWKEKLVTETKK